MTHSVHCVVSLTIRILPFERPVEQLRLTYYHLLQDMLRKALRRDVYPIDSPLHGPIHTGEVFSHAYLLRFWCFMRSLIHPSKLTTDHCLNHLRQMILCQGDLTPIPSKYYKGITDNYIFGDIPHTCRNWDSIREFITDRFNGSSAVPLAPGTVLSDPYKKLLGVLDEE